MNLRIRRTSKGKAEGGPPGDIEEDIALTAGSTAKLLGYLGLSGGGVATIVSLLLPKLFDLPAAAERRHCQEVRLVAVALQAESPSERRAGLELLATLKAVDSHDRLGKLLIRGSGTSAGETFFVPPRWTNLGALPSCVGQPRLIAPVSADAQDDSSDGKSAQPAPGVKR